MFLLTSGNELRRKGKNVQRKKEKKKRKKKEGKEEEEKRKNEKKNNTSTSPHTYEPVLRISPKLEI